jgi:hypothetical protein
MSWLGSLVNGVITAIVGAILAGVVASLAVDWYSVSSFEGGSGYFVVLFILLAIVAGFILGLVVSRIIAGRPNPGFLKGLGWSQLILFSIVAVVGGVARLMADVGPTLGGKGLIVNVEFRWPKGQEPPAAAEQWWVELASVSGHVQRNSEQGPVWREDARLEDSYWIVPGAVNLYTSRGDRAITLRPDGLIPNGYVAPIPAWPGRASLEWSEWYPQQIEGGPKLQNEFKYRWRLVQAGSPLRTQRIGDFEVTLLAESVGSVTYQGHPTAWTASGTYAIKYKGKPLSIRGRIADGRDGPPASNEASAVAVIPGTPPALVVMVNAERGYGDLTLLAPAGDSVRIEHIAQGAGIAAGAPLTDDPELFARLASWQSPDGQVDVVAYGTPGLYLFSNAILDTRTLSVRPFTAERVDNVIERINPLGVSPDGKSFVRLGYAPDSTDAHVFVVTNSATGQSYSLPIDKKAMRWGEYEDLTPLHVAHYFAWVKGQDGDDRLVTRQKVAPLPYRGRFTSYSGDYREFRMFLAKDTLRAAVLDWLVKEMGGSAADTSGDFAHSVMVHGTKVNVSWGKEDGHVGIWVDHGADMTLVDTIGSRLNALLATGTLDEHFEQ